MSSFRPRFFIDDSTIESLSIGPSPSGSEVTLGDNDSHHALRVLRLKKGDACEVVIGAAVYAAVVGSAKDPVSVVLDERLEGAEVGAIYRSRIGLVQAVTRPALLDQVLEKGTEVGASFFVLVAAAGSTRLPQSARVSRLERWRRIVVEAAKQSKQSVVPSVEFADSLEAALECLHIEGIMSIVLEPSASSTLSEVLGRRTMADGARSSSATVGEIEEADIALWVGPESGWSREESEWFAAAGIEAARLGRSVLRAETAGPVAVAAARLVTGDW